MAITDFEVDVVQRVSSRSASEDQHLELRRNTCRSQGEDEPPPAHNNTPTQCNDTPVVLEEATSVPTAPYMSARPRLKLCVCVCVCAFSVCVRGGGRERERGDGKAGRMWSLLSV